MSEQYLISNQTLTNIANAIREKKGTNDQILAGNFADEILGMATNVDTCTVELGIDNEGFYEWEEVWCVYVAVDADDLVRAHASRVFFDGELTTFTKVVVGSSFTIFSSHAGLSFSYNYDASNMAPLTEDRQVSSVTWLAGISEDDNSRQPGAFCTINIDPYFNDYAGADFEYMVDSLDWGYEFTRRADGYYVNTNQHMDETVCICRVELYVFRQTTITFTVLQDSENEYDFAYFGYLDQPLSDNEDEYINEEVYDYQYSTQGEYGIIGDELEYLYYNLTPGSHFIDIAYKKDSSEAEGEDLFGFMLDQPYATSEDVISGKYFIMGGERYEGTLTDLRGREIDCYVTDMDLNLVTLKPDFDGLQSFVIDTTSYINYTLPPAVTHNVVLSLELTDGGYLEGTQTAIDTLNTLNNASMCIGEFETEAGQIFHFSYDGETFRANYCTDSSGAVGQYEDTDGSYTLADFIFNFQIDPTGRLYEDSVGVDVRIKYA